MAEAHIVFQHGANEGIDPKLLPDGWLSRAENMRFRQDGRVGSRYGYAALAASTLTSMTVGAGNIGPKRSVYFSARTGAATPGTATERVPDGSYMQLTAAVGTLGVPRRTAAARNLQYTCVASDICAAGASIVVAYHDYSYAASADGDGLVAIVFEALSMRARARIVVGAGARNPKLVAIDATTVGLVYESGGVISYKKINVPAQLGATPTVTLTVLTVVTPFAGRSFAFDACAVSASQFAIAFETSAINLRWGVVDTATGVFANRQDQVIANPARPSLTLATGGANIAMCWAEGATFNTGNLHYLVTQVNGGSITTKTTLDTSGLVVGFPTAGPDGTDFAFCWNRSDNTTNNSRSGAAASTFWRLAVVGRPFAGPLGSALAWHANFADTGNTAGLATYKLMDLGAVTAANTGPNCEALSCPRAAMPGAYLTTSATNQTFLENRRSCVTVTTLDASPGATAFAAFLPVATANGFGADVVRVDNGTFVDTLLPATLNNQLFFSGARVREFDGIALYESGLADGPEYFAVANAGAGAIAAGTYQYVAIYSWFDANGNRHRSPVSAIAAITLGGASNVTVSYSVQAFSARTYGTTAEVCIEIYRTLAAGSIFHLVNSTHRIPAGTLDGTIRTYTDSATDATIGVNEVLYTQGERGGLSGLLENNEPPPCTFLCGGNGRLMMGGLENRSNVQWSKLVFPGEPVQFSNTSAYQQTIDGVVTAGCNLDGTWYIFTANRVYASQGQGPEDNGTGGSFGLPVQLPSDVGCISQRSLVACQHGIFFQSSQGIYLLPRGGNVPNWIGKPIQSTLAAYPFIAAAALVANETCVVFSALTAAADDGRLLIYDTHRKEWFVDSLFNGAAASTRVVRTLDVFDGKLVLNGQIGETSLYEDGETGSQHRAIVETFITGDMRPFGALGHGRVRRAVLLAEYRSAATFTVEESVDGGVTWQSPAASFTPTNSAGDTVRVGYDLPIVRGEAYRFRIISTPSPAGEGMVFHALSLELFPDKGTPRLANAYRT